MPEVNEQAAAAKKQYAEEQKMREVSTAQYNQRMQGKPTPTQEENDLAMLGGFVTGSEHEDDGSGPDPNNEPFGAPKTRQLEADRAKPYQTRAATAKPASS